jgi:peptide/nickel transport system ATP-binding protein
VPSNSSDVLLKVEGLKAAYRVEGGHVPAVRDWTLAIQPGKVTGLLGESGCGKTTATLALLGLMPSGALVNGSVRFQGDELIGATEATLRSIRGARISMIPQEPSLSLNPVIRVIDQVAEVVRAHQRTSAAELRQRARTMLEQVGLAEDKHAAYPHQLSGGQRQRVLIAQALVCSPPLVIADEPTGALDAVAAREILELLRNLVRQRNASLLLITHDPRVLAEIADRVLVMYAGTIVEAGPALDVLRQPLHPYTRGLLACLRDPLQDAVQLGDRHIAAIAGAAPDFQSLPPGCTFEPRCQDRMSACAESEPTMTQAGTRKVRCVLYGSSR